LAEIAKLIDAGNLKPLVDNVMEFEQFQKAFNTVESRKMEGKGVLKVTIQELFIDNTTEFRTSLCSAVLHPGL